MGLMSTRKLQLKLIGAGCSQVHLVTSGILITLEYKENDLILSNGEYPAHVVASTSLKKGEMLVSFRHILE